MHADDFGLSEAVNRGVIAAHRDGILTSASLMVTGDAFEHAAALARANPSLDVGVHLTLTEHRPLTDPATVPSLVDEQGRFLPHAIAFGRRYLNGRIELTEVRTELDAQIRRAAHAELPISHLDGHQHVHVLPGVAHVVADLAEQHGIRAVRHPAERLRAYMLRDLRGIRRVAEKSLLKLLCALSPLRSLKRTDDFVGFYFGGRLTEQNLVTVLERVGLTGTTELMCHPGESDPASPYRHWGYAWAAEVAALSSARVKELLRARGLTLISYRDV